MLLGVATAGIVHATKATARPVVNATTVGVGTPVVSAAEDVASLGMSLIAVFLPILTLVVLICSAGRPWPCSAGPPPPRAGRVLTWLPDRSARKSSQVRRPTARSGARWAPARTPGRPAGSLTGTSGRRRPVARR